jgi:hypothetical protein
MRSSASARHIRRDAFLRGQRVFLQQVLHQARAADGALRSRRLRAIFQRQHLALSAPPRPAGAPAQQAGTMWGSGGRVAA